MAIVEMDFSESGLLIPVASPKEMISVSKQDDGRTRVKINSSSLGVIQECLRKSYYLLDQKWKAENEHPATIFGSAIHKALEVFYLGKMEERVLPKLDDLELMAYGHALPEEGSSLIMRAVRAFLSRGEQLRPLPDTDKRSLPNGVWILHNYFKAFLADPYIAYVDEQGPFVEREFTFRLFEDAEKVIDVFGTIDFAFKHTANGNIIIGDHKTASSFGFGGSSYFDRERPNHQYTGYAMGARRVFGIETDEFMVNMVEVKARPKTARGSGPLFPRQITTRNEEDFEEFTEVVVHSVENYLGALKTGMWPLGPVGACTAYGSCTYRQVCAAPKSMRENILSAKFKRGS
jgi:hypothetical protein